MEEFTSVPANINLNINMKTIKIHSIMKNIGQRQNFRRNAGDLKNSKNNLNNNFIF